MHRSLIIVLILGCSHADVDSIQQAEICGDNEITLLDSYNDEFDEHDVTFDMIERRAGAVGVLFCPATDTPYCSGTLISGTLFLTAAHCIDSCEDAGGPVEPNELEVVFGYRLAGRPSFPSSSDLRRLQHYEVEELVEIGDPMSQLSPDYAILRLGPCIPFEIEPEVFVCCPGCASLPPGLSHGITPIRDRQVDDNEPVFLLGHPDFLGFGTGGFYAADPISIAAGRVTSVSLPDGMQPLFGHSIDTEGAASGGGVLDSDGYLLGVHRGGDCEGASGENVAEPIAGVFDVSPALVGQTPDPAYSVPFQNDRMLVTTLNSGGSVQGHTMVSFDTYTPSYANAEAEAAVFSPSNQLRLAGSASNDHGEYFAAVARVDGKFTLGRYVLDTSAVGTGGDDERFRAASIARTLTGIESGLMAAGQVKVGLERQILLAAFQPAADALQTSFGQTGAGYTITNIPSLSDEHATAIYSRSVLEHYVAGNGTASSGDRYVFIARYNSSGAVDTSFGTAGFVIYDPGSAYEAAVVEAITEFGGRLYIVGHVRNATTGKRSALIASFKRTTGALNGVNIYGGTSVYEQNIDGVDVLPDHMEARSVTVDSQGRLTMVGVARYWSDVRFAYLGRAFTRRYNASPLLVDGSHIPFVGGGLNTVARAVGLRANEGVVAVGDTTTTLSDVLGVVLRMQPSGALDITFSSNGSTWVDISPALTMRYDDVIVTPGDTVYAIGEVEIDPTNPP